MNITIYGPSGCSNCTALKETTESVVKRNDIDADVTKEEDMTKLAEKGIMSTPGFEIDDEMIFSGSTPSEDKLRSIITERL
ncbi:thioredoxin family protein [Halorubrum sp. BOL3-1]|uniref:thioredoxin family protein n=1 Tax=Halorubrum sp. BOL3-1 TaxID=2497325 RepID=UPI0010052182|nr:thioredoxin family protein [Halorubrum sp. BOL3-1]QAU14146.1 thioredoxin family protein [Halorubrum sp. BOL3-1]